MNRGSVGHQLIPAICAALQGFAPSPRSRRNVTRCVLLFVANPVVVNVQCLPVLEFAVILPVVLDAFLISIMFPRTTNYVTNNPEVVLHR